MAERELPLTVTQLTGQGLTTVTNKLTAAGLGVLLLNIIGIGAAVYFLNVLITGQQEHLVNLLDVQKAQVTQVLRTHDREFDALMALVHEQMIRPPSLETQQPVLPPLAPPPPEPQSKGRNR